MSTSKPIINKSGKELTVSYDVDGKIKVSSERVVVDEEKLSIADLDYAISECQIQIKEYTDRLEDLKQLKTELEKMITDNAAEAAEGVENGQTISE